MAPGLQRFGRVQGINKDLSRKHGKLHGIRRTAKGGVNKDGGLKNMQNSGFKHIRPCSYCHGSGEVMGAAMRIYCHKCSGIGFLVPCASTDLPARKMQLANEVRRLAALVNSKPVQAVHDLNSKGPGGACFTGD